MLSFINAGSGKSAAVVCAILMRCTAVPGYRAVKTLRGSARVPHFHLLASVQRMVGMLEVVRYVLVPPAFVEAAFLPPPPLQLVLRARSPTPRLPALAGLKFTSAWRGGTKAGELKVTQTKTTRVPMPPILDPRRDSNGDPCGTIEFDRDHGLLCMERDIPGEVSRGLGRLAGEADPFKSEVLRGRDRWLDRLTRPLAHEPGTTAGTRERQRALDVDGKPREGVGLLSSAGNVGDHDAEQALRWLKDDVRHVAQVFVDEVSRLPAPWDRQFASERSKGGDEEEQQFDVTVKLELLRKGKCPRYHLDKVPLRLICTYLGPSTEWLEGYDRWEMENNRTVPPGCNAKISGGAEARRARAGDVLIFRGEPPGGDAIGVAHRSPDMDPDQRRVVLTMDIGNIRAPR